MNETNFFKKLLDGAKVAWVPLGEISNVLKGKQLNKTELLEVGDYPAYNGGTSYSGFTDKYNVEENTVIYIRQNEMVTFKHLLNVIISPNNFSIYAMQFMKFLTSL